MRLVVIAFVIATPLAYTTFNWWLGDFAYRIVLGVGLLVIAGLATLLFAFLTIGREALKAVSNNPVDNLRYE